MVDFDMMLAAKADALGVSSDQIMWVIARSVVNGDIDPDDDQLSVLLTLNR
ncbi:hypothetical protein [Vibrio lentus]|uniref:hypothetical protein n=1 Tax=Vibrio lentus TaxID=136468 RepID=UPI00178CC104|nr:hypothetical protein [Vibrio lentus]MDN3632660.1 hypothetical protein [Vibrio lentus]